MKAEFIRMSNGDLALSVRSEDSNERILLGYFAGKAKIFVAGATYTSGEGYTSITIYEAKPRDKKGGEHGNRTS